MTRTICLHGPESTGKSTLAPRLAARLNGTLIEEYGRTYAEANGIDFTMADLLLIAQGHDDRTRAAIARGDALVILDTDPLMSAVWADMLFGVRDPWFDAWRRTADFYLLFDIDLPWIGDGTRMFGSAEARQRFFDLSRAELDRRRVPYALVSGHGEERFRNALAAIEAAGFGGAAQVG